MKKKIAILGSTGSIGQSLLKILKNDKKKFEILLLTTNNDYKKVIKQAKEFKVNNVIITSKTSYKLALKKNKNINIYNDFNNFRKIFKKKIDYLMNAISGLDGLIPTIKAIKYTKTIAIANKESIICGWNLINSELTKFKTKFVPVDSEHFTIWYGLKNNFDKIDKLYLTASGGPFLSYSISDLKKIKISEAINHPNWKMGKKISVDSATMMNKVFEVIEAKKIFNISYDKIDILIHPKSYIHSIINFRNGLIKIIAHETDMKIPISNSLYTNYNENIKPSHINLKILNDLSLSFINSKKFPTIKILNLITDKNSLFETVIVSANDELVKLFLDNKIKFNQIGYKLLSFLKKKQFDKYKQIAPKSVADIVKLNNYVRLKINPKSI